MYLVLLVLGGSIIVTNNNFVYAESDFACSPFLYLGDQRGIIYENLFYHIIRFNEYKMSMIVNEELVMKKEKRQCQRRMVITIVVFIFL
uniref:Uncharacterized protein n=1 Tax=Kalanchoe fedtschenkoi TaxID=63787 RepID=A0A7N0ZXF7_KALFE